MFLDLRMADACCFLKPQKFVEKNKILDGKIQASREFRPAMNICIISSIYILTGLSETGEGRAQKGGRTVC